MKPVKRFEPVTKSVVRTIQVALGAIGSMVVDLGQVDIRAGCGVINDHTRCLWTHDRHRIEVWTSTDGGFGASKSKEPDLEWSPEVRK